MTKIITHADSDGICAAALVKMTQIHKVDEVYFSHPMGLFQDLGKIEEDLIILDIAIDIRDYKAIYKQLEAISAQHSVLYIDHHDLPGSLPPRVKVIWEEIPGTTELVFRYFYHELPKWADRLTCIGAICDYCDDSPLIKEMMYRFERRTLFLDAGLLAQGLRGLSEDYDTRRNLIQSFSEGSYPCELPALVKAAIKTTQEDKVSRQKVLKMYRTGKMIAWVISPPASKSKAAHWIMGDSGKIVGLTVNYKKSRPELVDITIRGRELVDLREIIPSIAQKLGGSGGGHRNAIGCRIPKNKLEKFFQILDDALITLQIPPPSAIEHLLHFHE